MSFNEAVRNINVQKYLEEKDGFGDGGRFGKRSNKEESEKQGDLLANQAKIQERKIAEALEKEDKISSGDVVGNEQSFDKKKKTAIDNIKFFLRQKNRKDIDVIDKEGYFKALHILLEHGGSPGEYDRSGKSNLEVKIGDFPVHLKKLFWWKGNKGDRHHYMYIGLTSKRGTKASFLLQMEKYSILPVPTILTARNYDNSRKIGQILNFLSDGLNEMNKTEIGQDKIRYNRASF